MLKSNTVPASADKIPSKAQRSKDIISVIVNGLSRILPDEDDPDAKYAFAVAF